MQKKANILSNTLLLISLSILFGCDSSSNSSSRASASNYPPGVSQAIEVIDSIFVGECTHSLLLYIYSYPRGTIYAYNGLDKNDIRYEYSIESEENKDVDTANGYSGGVYGAIQINLSSKGGGYVRKLIDPDDDDKDIKNGPWSKVDIYFSPIFNFEHDGAITKLSDPLGSYSRRNRGPNMEDRSSNYSGLQGLYERICSSLDNS